MIRLYDLAGADPDIRFSPHCWRIRMALAHKGLEAEAVPWRFTDKAAIAFSGQGRVPVLVDGDTTVVESWNIASHIDKAYPDTPPLLTDPQAAAHARFIARWTERVLQAGLLRLILLDIYDLIDALQWARVVSPRAILAEDDPILAWFRTMLGLFDGLGAAMPARG